MLKISKKSGFASFTEVIISTTIFLITAVGIYSTVAMISPQAAVSTRKLEAANAGRSAIDQLLYDVSAVTWDDPAYNYISGRVYTKPLTGNMTINYMFTDVLDSGNPYPNGGSPRQLSLNVYY